MKSYLIFLLFTTLITVGCIEEEKSVRQSSTSKKNESNDNINSESSNEVSSSSFIVSQDILPESKFATIPANGENFNELASSNIFDIAIHSNGRKYIATRAGLSYTTNEGFKTLTSANFESSSDIHEIFIDSRGDIYLGTSSNKILYSRDNGQTWNSHQITSKESYNLAHFNFIEDNSGNIYVTSSGDYRIYKTTDRGDTWTTNRVVSYCSECFKDMEMDSYGNIFVTSDHGIYGGLFISTDGGQNFNTYTGMSKYVSSVFIDSDNTVYFTVKSGSPGLYKMEGSASNPTFTQIVSNENAYDFVIKDGVWFLATNSGLLISRSADGNGDRIWESKLKTQGEFHLWNVRRILDISDGIYFLGCHLSSCNYNKGVVKTTDLGQTYTSLYTEITHNFNWANAPAKFIAVHGNEYYYTDVRAIYLSNDEGNSVAKKYEFNDDVYGINVDSNGNLFVISPHDKIYKKASGSEDFVLFHDFTSQINSYIIDENDEHWVANRTGYYTSADNFSTERRDGLIGYDSATQTCTAGGTSCYYVGKIFKKGQKVLIYSNDGTTLSTDGGSTWNPVDFDGDGTIDSNSVLALFIDHNGYYFIGKNNDYYKSTDNGSTWTSYSAPSLGKMVVDQNNTVFYSKYNSTTYCSKTQSESDFTCYDETDGIPGDILELTLNSNNLYRIMTKSGIAIPL